MATKKKTSKRKAALPKKKYFEYEVSLIVSVESTKGDPEVEDIAEHVYQIVSNAVEMVAHGRVSDGVDITDVSNGGGSHFCG